MLGVARRAPTAMGGGRVAEATGLDRRRTASGCSGRRSSAGCGTSAWRASTTSRTNGPAVLCPNHISFLDSAFLMLLVPRRISFVGKAEYMNSWKTKYLFPMLGMIPIDRGGGAKSIVALDAAEAVLRRGELMGIFPEGTRSRDGYLYKGHTGRRAAGGEGRLPDPARSASSAPIRSSRPTPSCPSPSGRPASRSGGRSAPSATGIARTSTTSCASSSTRSCSRSAR